MLFAQAQALHTAKDITGSIVLARRAIEADPQYVEPMELLAMALITRQRRYADGLAMIDRAIVLRDSDAGLWYTLGWLYEFVAHEIRRRDASSTELAPSDLYRTAAEAFRRCLSLNPDGKLQGDAEDLLDHVENELRSL